MSRVVGFSTGCLKDFPWSLKKKIDFIKAVGSSAIEVSFATPQEFFESGLCADVLRRLMDFAHVSIHAPWKGIVYERTSLDALNVVSRLIDVFHRLPSAHAVMHPDIIVSDISYFNSCLLPLWLENMDARKKIGVRPEEFVFYREKSDFGFVLDLQHVYEHDPSMALVDGFLEAMGEFHLGEVHISGQSGEYRHLPLASSDNSTAIMAAGKKVPIWVPFISEGVIPSSDEAEMFKAASLELSTLSSI